MENNATPYQVIPHAGNLELERIESKSRWFDIYKLNAMTYALAESNHFEEVISYLILGETKAILFDTGMGIGDIRAEVTSLTPLPIVVINSHSHYDHIGGNRQFDEIWSFKNTFENDRIQSGYSHSECMTYMTDGCYVNLPAAFELSTFSVPGVRITKYLHHKETIDIGGRILTVHSTPGETPGAISLSDDLYNTLFVGDLLYPGPLWLHLDESDWPGFARSIEYLSGLPGIQYICPAHNEARINPDFVRQVKQGIASINQKAIKGVKKDEALQFSFDGFSILTKNMSTP
ncbi:MBL fold metallo-hydrolase [Chryseolinea soli]|uniref:MBL fold metallo-hydrolase n=1 Tax=Chryseolinea soli TaxID=2321403 RepID=A0A385SWZ3_9BACT|nr:MBL fold metallo-hydrolase [Chryseolinea soli]AYB35116.1 MBL fold metallo-hydrolase [Chryseolinea soli]